MYKRKTADEYQIWVNYGQGWEHETTETTREAFKENLKAYRLNCPYPVKTKKVRVKIEPSQESTL